MACLLESQAVAPGQVVGEEARERVIAHHPQHADP